MGGLFSSPGLQYLMANVQVLTARERAISQNVANVDTPGYQAINVNFPLAMAQALAEQAAPGGTGIANPATMPLVGNPGVMQVDGNGVNLDKQMVQLAKTNTWYAASSEDLMLQMKVLKLALTDGGAIP